MLQVKEITKLGGLLAATLVQVDRVAGLYPRPEELEGIQLAGLQKLSNICENTGEIPDLASWHSGWVEHAQLIRQALLLQLHRRPPPSAGRKAGVVRK